MYENSMRRTIPSTQQRLLLDINLCRQELVQLDLAIKSSTEEVRTLSQASQRDLSLMTKLVNDKCQTMVNKLDEFQLHIQKVRLADDRDELTREAANHAHELQRNQALLRAATLTAMHTMEHENRQSLLTGGDASSEIHRRNVRAGALRDEASNVTNSLTTLLGRMNEQVQQSETTLSTLIDSSSMIKATDKEMHTMGGEIKTSGKLLNRYDRRELTDKLLIALALLMFLLTVAYIVQKRVFGHIHWW